LENITAQTYCIFDIDPSLLANTGLSECPVVVPGAPYPTDADALPRLDPASFKIVERGGQLISILVIERYQASAVQKAESDDNETRGSVLFLDAENALAGTFEIMERVPVGVDGSRLEVIDSAEGGRWIFVSISNGGGEKGTFARLELLTQ